MIFLMGPAASFFLTKCRQTVLRAPWTDFDNFWSFEKLCFWIFEEYFFEGSRCYWSPKFSVASSSRWGIQNFQNASTRCSQINMWEWDLQLKVPELSFELRECEYVMRYRNLSQVISGRSRRPQGQEQEAEKEVQNSGQELIRTSLSKVLFSLWTIGWNYFEF